MEIGHEDLIVHKTYKPIYMVGTSPPKIRYFKTFSPKILMYVYANCKDDETKTIPKMRLCKKLMDFVYGYR